MPFLRQSHHVTLTTLHQPRKRAIHMNHNHTIIGTLRTTISSTWLWNARIYVAILAVAFLVTGCGHPH